MKKAKQASGIRLGVGLLRVSTDRQFAEGESIENQQRKVEYVARRDRIDIVRFFVEHYSGRKTDRSVIDQVFAFLKDNPDVEVAIVGDIDRFTRGGSEIYLRLRRELRALGVDLVDTTGIIQPERNRLEHLGVEYDWAVESPSRYAEVFMAEKARSEASDILTRTIGQQIQLTRDGYQCRGSNFGYRNIKITTPDGKKKTIMEPDPVEGPWVVRMFKLRAEGTWQDDAICDAINAMGYRSRPMNIYDQETRQVLGKTDPKVLDPKQLQKFISRTIYCGVKLEKWNQGQPVIAPIEPLISIELFNRANRGKLKISKKRDGSLEIVNGGETYQNHKHNPDFLLRHVVKCPECGKPFTGSKSRGKAGKLHGYYHCSRGHKYLGINKKEFESSVANLLDRLQAKPGFLDLFREVVRDVWIQKNRAKRDLCEDIETHLRSLKGRQSALIDRLAACSSSVVISKLETQIEDLEEAIKAAELRLDATEISEAEIDAYFQLAKNTMEHPRDHVFSALTKEEIEKYWGFIFKSSPTWRDITDGTPELTLIYRLNRDFHGDESMLAGQLSMRWNTFVEDVERVLEA